MLELAEAEFEGLVIEAIDELAPEVARLDNVAIFVEDVPTTNPSCSGSTRASPSPSATLPT